MDASHSQALSDLDKHGLIINIHHLFRGYLSDIQSHAIERRLGLLVVNEARSNEEVHERVQLEPLNAVDDEFSPVIGDHRYLQAVTGLEVTA
jgi:hypothetical protein